MPHALILGCGDLGSRTAQLLIADGYSATGVRRRPFVLPGGVALSLDLADPQAIEQLPRRADVVIVALTPSQRTPEAYRATYLDLPRLVSRTVTAPHWVFVSSTAVYGEHQTTLPDRWIDETVLPAPDRFNGEVLLAAEQQLRAQVPRLTVVRCSSDGCALFGAIRTGAHCAHRARCARRQGRFQWTNRIHIDDAARAVHWCVTAGCVPENVIATDLLPSVSADVHSWISAQQSGECPETVVLHSHGQGRRLRPQALLDAGFEWRFPSFREGYRELLKASNDSPQAPLAL